MKVLHKDDKSDDDCGPIIACGIHPQDKMLVTLTSDGTFYELDAEKFFLTDDLGDDSYPIMNGSVLEFVRSASIITVDSIDVLNASKKIQLSNLEIGMGHENGDLEFEKVDKGDS